MEDKPLSPMRYPSVNQIALGSAAIGGLQSILIYGKGTSLANSPFNRAITEAIYSLIGSFVGSKATPLLLPYVRNVPNGNPSATDPTKEGVVSDNMIQVMIPPTIAGMTNAGLLSVLNGENQTSERLRNFMLGFVSQTAGYYVADFYENQNIF